METETSLPPPGYSWVETKDGSRTLFSELFSEACHSPTGARSETIHYYVEGCEVAQKLIQQGQLHILEVGFGLGLGLLTTWQSLRDLPGTVYFTSLESDRSLLEWFRLNSSEFQELCWREGPHPILEGKKDNMYVRIFCGDARATLAVFQQSAAPPWDAIYQDAFSPKKNPSLWTKEWFEHLKLTAAPDVILSTYSASYSIRKSLLEAGWSLQEGGKFGPKRASTLARLTGETSPEILQRLARSPVTSLKDKDL